MATVCLRDNRSMQKAMHCSILQNSTSRYKVAPVVAFPSCPFIQFLRDIRIRHCPGVLTLGVRPSCEDSYSLLGKGETEVKGSSSFLLRDHSWTIAIGTEQGEYLAGRKGCWIF